MKKWISALVAAIVIGMGLLAVPKIRRHVRSAIRKNPVYLRVRHAKFPPRGPAGPVPRTLDGKPDLSGVWGPQMRLPNEDDPLLLPAARETQKRREEIMNQGFHAFCRPPGPLIMGQSTHELIVGADRVAEISESPGVRMIRMDGKGHRASPEPSFNGDAIAWWDGDTLVVDSIGFNDQTWMLGDATPHTGQLHVLQRYTRLDKGTLQMDVTVEDPGVLSEPWHFRSWAKLEDQQILYETVCNENERDADHMGK